MTTLEKENNDYENIIKEKINVNMLKYIKNSHYDETIYNYFTSGIYYKVNFENIICKMTNQKKMVESISGEVIGIFDINLNDEKSDSSYKLYDDLHMGNKYFYPFLRICEETLRFFTLLYHDMIKFIESNESYYIYYPLRYLGKFNEEKTEGHRALIIIDKKNKTVKLFDPNVVPTFFNKIKKNTNRLIEDMLFYYYKNINYEYIYIKKWRQVNHSTRLNGKPNITKKYDLGICGPICIFIAHYISLTNESVDSIIKNLLDLPSDILRLMFYNYQSNIYSIMIE